jgi:hypothetical protein
MLQDLLLHLSQFYPEYTNFSMYYNTVRNFETTIIPTVFEEFKSYALKYKTFIFSRDERFFLELDDVSLGGFMSEINQIKNLFELPKTTPTSKEHIWDYIVKLTNIALKEVN